MEKVVGQLKNDVFDKISCEIKEKNNLINNLENNIEFLENNLKNKMQQFIYLADKNKKTSHDNTKIEVMNERLDKEQSYMNLEIPMLKEKINNMKNEIFAKDSETTKLKNMISKQDSVANWIKDETRKNEKNNNELKNDKMNLRAQIVMLKKNNDFLKQKIIKQDAECKTFVTDVSALLDREKA